MAPWTPDVSIRAWMEDWAREQGSRLLYWQETSCINDRTKNLKDQLFNFCNYFELTASCTGSPNYFEFPSCKGSECDLALDWDALQCVFNAVAFQVGNSLDGRNGSMCDILINGPPPSKMIRQDWIFPVPGRMERPACFAPWPNQTTFANKVKCVNDFPRSIIDVDLGMSLSQDKFTCVLASTCGDMKKLPGSGNMQPMYMMCVEKVKGFRFPALDCYDVETEATDSDEPFPAPVDAGEEVPGAQTVEKQGVTDRENETRGVGTCRQPWTMTVLVLALGAALALLS
eukprot:evm.model.scf_750.7 EVM.evm.TU.scf_750.7   scf_750:49546-51092(+)